MTSPAQADVGKECLRCYVHPTQRPAILPFSCYFHSGALKQELTLGLKETELLSRTHTVHFSMYEELWERKHLVSKAWPLCFMWEKYHLASECKRMVFP